MEEETNILVVEDNLNIIEGLKHVLEKEGFIINVATTKKDAISKINKNRYDLFLLDVQLPDGTGFEICKYIKERYNIPVILSSAIGEESNVVYGFDLGADDFITKPYRNNELIARINCVLRRNQNKDNTLTYKGIKVDLSNAQVVNSNTDEEIFFTSIEYKLLLLLMKNRNKLVTRNEILEKVWDTNESFVNDNTLSVYIKRIRDKIGDSGEKATIQTIRGIGYILNE